MAVKADIARIFGHQLKRHPSSVVVGGGLVKVLVSEQNSELYLLR